MQFKWPVVPICEAQKLDVKPSDLLNGGLYRKCNTYKAGGGYDKFPGIWERRYGQSLEGHATQFVVQLHGCSLKCPYCYVTEAGVYGAHESVSTEQMVNDFYQSGCDVFHLMGGAPALYMKHWPELLERLGGAIFHSDFVLNEGDYDLGILKEIATFKNQLHAVSIKGADVQEYRRNTNTEVDPEQILGNLDKLVESGIPFYVTFTGMSAESIEGFKRAVGGRFAGTDIFKDSFAIQLVDYRALHYGEEGAAERDKAYMGS